MVNWVLDAHSPKTQRVILTGKQEFLNSDSSQDNPSIFAKKPTASPPETERVELEQQGDAGNSAWDFLKGDFSFIPQEHSTDESESKMLQLLQEMVTSEDPVTDLFPETEWYDEIDLTDYDFADLLTTEKEGREIPLDHTLDSEVVGPLLEEIRSRAQEKLESNPFESIEED